MGQIKVDNVGGRENWQLKILNLKSNCVARPEVRIEIEKMTRRNFQAIDFVNVFCYFRIAQEIIEGSTHKNISSHESLTIFHVKAIQ